MRASRPLRSTVNVCLLALLTALATGLPSHHHADAMAAADETRLVAADHHAHATQLVEQDDRVPSGGMPLATVTSVALARIPADRGLAEPVPSQLPHPRVRAPPSGAPRAPPPRL